MWQIDGLGERGEAPGAVVGVKADRKQMSATLEEILAASMARNWEYGRRGDGGGGREVAESDAGSNGTWYE